MIGYRLVLCGKYAAASNRVAALVWPRLVSSTRLSHFGPLLQCRLTEVRRYLSAHTIWKEA
ncbi:hypothetical protein M404DRAFT_580239 [Pisolithus tinctorius Marx 270]|uniref:Uncharacterized protein n=1 Tax=Pisolithus tinctorius Marx 270 TaxID=870435 RepID=A0A0C3PVZ6_PISTI|nr:hypothetical protein M404DRAFT_580239 [Pisolithus tinctorius Marx 270]